MARADRRTLTVAAVVVAALLLLALIVVRVGGGSPLSRPPEDYLTEKARQLAFDRNRIVAFVRDTVEADHSYRGALRGPVGTLWARSGDDLDRALLLRGLLDRAHVRTRLVLGSTYGVEIEAGNGRFAYVGPAVLADPQARPLAAIPAAEYHVIDVSVKWKGPDGSESSDAKLSLRTADIVPTDLVVSYRRSGSKILTVLQTGPRSAVGTTDVRNAVRQQLVFDFRGPGETASEVRRELFTKEFADFPSFFDPTNRYDVIVTAGWVPDSVRVHEARTARTFASPTDARAHLVAYTFLARSDADATAAARAKHVRAHFVSPRLTIVSDERQVGGSPEARSVAIDLRKNDLSVDGAVRTRVAFGTLRSLYDASLESQVLRTVTGQSAYSAVTALAGMGRGPTSIGERQELLRSSLARLLQENRPGASLSVWGEGRPAYSVTFATTPKGIRVSSSEAVRAALATRPSGDRWLLGNPVFQGGGIGKAAVETEVALAVAAGLPASYVPAYRYTEAPAGPWYANARVFYYASFGGEERLTFEQQFLSLAPDLTIDAIDYFDEENGQFVDQPVHSAITVGAVDLEQAPAYTDWFHGNQDAETGRSWSMISRKAYADLLRTGSTVIRYRFQDGRDSDPMRLWLAGRGTDTLVINNRPVKIKVLRLNGGYVKDALPKPKDAGSGPNIPDPDDPGRAINKITILDDSRFPIESPSGPGNRVQTVIPGHVVDAVTGRGVAGATVMVSEPGVSALTWPDGGFDLPSFTLPFGEFSVNVEAPGYRSLSVTKDFRLADTLPLSLKLQPEGPAQPVTWIDSENVDSVLPGLPLTEHSKRLIADTIAADPTRGALVPPTRVSGPDGLTDAWLEVRKETGEVYGVLADGLYGSTGQGLANCALGAGKDAAKAYASGGAPPPGGLQSCGISYFSGRVAGWYLFAAGTLDSVSKAIDDPTLTVTDMHKNAIATARAMAGIYQGWAFGAAVDRLGGSSGAFLQGLSDSLDWAEEFYAQAWGV